MSAFATHATSLPRIPLATLAATIALSIGIGCAGAAAAAGLASDEVKRKPVSYHAGSNCYGTQVTCNFSLASTPAKSHKRLEIAGISCIAKTYAEGVYRVSIFSQTTTAAYDHLELTHTGTYNGQEQYVARSTMRYFAPIDDEIKATVFASSDISQFYCTLQGTIVTYKKSK